MRIHAYLSLFRENADFTRLYSAQLISFGGEWFATVALLGLFLDLSESAAVASLVLVLQTGGFAAFAPMAGILADRLDRRRLLVFANVARAPLPLALLLVGDAGSLWIAFLLIVAMAAGAAIFEPTSSASLPNLVDPRRLPEANVLIGSAWGTMLAVGAAAGGVAAATLGREAVFLTTAATFSVSAWIISRITRPLQQPRVVSYGDSHPGIAQSLGTAIAFARSRRLVGAFLLSKTAFGFGAGIVALLAVFGAGVFRAGDAGIGLLFAARGLGALAGPFVARALFGTSDRGLLLGIGTSLALVAASYCLFPIAPVIGLAALLVFTAHCGAGAQWTLSTLGLQRVTPDALRGRLFSFDYMLVTLTITFSSLIAGFLADALSAQIAVWVMVCLVLLSGAVWAGFARTLILGDPEGNDRSPVSAGSD
jgi:MFS family permease